MAPLSEAGARPSDVEKAAAATPRVETGERASSADEMQCAGNIELPEARKEDQDSGCKGKGKGKGYGDAAGKGNGKDSGKANGKSIGKTPPPPPRPRAGNLVAAKAKAANNGYTAGKTMRPDVWAALPCLSTQKADGHFEAETLVECLRSIYDAEHFRAAAAAIDFHGIFAQHPALPTCFVLALNERMMGFTAHSWSGVSVQTVGSGRGDVEKVKEGTGELSAEDVAERRAAMTAHLVKTWAPACGLEWAERAQEWLTQQQPPEDLHAVADALVDDWFQKFQQRSHGRGLSEEERKKREEERRRKDEAGRLEEVRRVQHWRSMSGRPVDEVPWQSMKTVMWCNGGSGGALLVQIGDSEAVVVKPQGMSAVAETLAVELAGALDVRVAATRVLTMLQEEFFTVAEAIHNAPFMVEQHRVYAGSIIAGVKEVAAVIEFVPGCTLQGIDGQNALKSDHSDAVLRALGAVIGLDCLLNNVDRVPAIWMNDGNLGNVMLRPDGGLIGIDQQLCAIADLAGRTRYLTSVRSFCGDAKHGRLESPAVGRIKTAVLENCGVDLDARQCQLILEGASDTFQRVCQKREELLALLPQLERRMIALFGETSVDVGLSRLDLMLDFVGACIEAVAEAYA